MKFLTLTTPWFLQRAHFGVRWYRSEAALKKNAGGIPSSGFGCWDIKLLMSTPFGKFILFFSFIYDNFPLFHPHLSQEFSSIIFFIKLLNFPLLILIKLLTCNTQHFTKEKKSLVSCESARHRRGPEEYWIEKCCTKLIFWYFNNIQAQRKKPSWRCVQKSSNGEWFNNNIQPTKKQYGMKITETVKHRLSLIVGCCSPPWAQKLLLILPHYEILNRL